MARAAVSMIAATFGIVLSGLVPNESFPAITIDIVMNTTESQIEEIKK